MSWNFIMIILYISNTNKLSIVNAQKFQPYQLNGGLITAIAGKDYVLIASDTRLSDEYEIKSRSHLSSRLWSVGSESSSESPYADIFDYDGSIRLPPSLSTPTQSQIISSDNEGCYTPTFIGSSGCVADCIALQRQFRSEVSAHTYWTGERLTTHLTPRQVSILLMNTLYNRRAFPFYSFCIVAGLNSHCNTGGDATKKKDLENKSKKGDDIRDGHGAVYVYDAIGSNERVAVAAVGTGRELMQPVLDRLFAISTVNTASQSKNAISNSSSSSIAYMERDGNAVAVEKQKSGNILLPPVNTCVSHDCEEAVDLLMKAYRSVAEREIGVGDDVVVCIMKRHTQAEIKQGGKRDGYHHTLEVRKFSLKKH